MIKLLGASLLSRTPGGDPDTIDANNIADTKLIRFSGSSTNIPTLDAPHGSWLLNLVHGSDYIIQFVYGRSGENYTRCKNAGSWTNWRRVYDESILTNSTLLSPLASVLGAETFSSCKIVTLEAGAEHIESQIGGNACGLWQICETSSYGSAKLFINKHGSVIDIYSDTAGGLSNVIVTKTTAWEFKITNNNSSRISLVLKKL